MVANVNGKIKGCWEIYVYIYIKKKQRNNKLRYLS